MLLQTLQATLASRQERGLLRSLVQESEPVGDVAAQQQQHASPPVDFSSNDYLGLARSPELAAAVEAELNAVKSRGVGVLGSTGSRLLTGDSWYARELEGELAEFHATESALLFNSGYDANVSLFSSLPQPDGIVLYDELMHASCHEGMRLCRSKIRTFEHNNLESLRAALREESRPLRHVLIAVESVYSMDGHLAPLQEICDLAKEFGAEVLVDEAHGTGIYGAQGRGLCQHLGVQPFARVHTFGKAVGCHGAVIVGPAVLRSYLLNYAKPLIFSTSMPMHSLVNIRCAYRYMQQVADERQVKLRDLVQLFQSEVKKRGINAVESPSAIQAIIVPGNDNVVKTARMMRQKGFWILPIRSPTVPAGTERLRIVLHSYNSKDEIVNMLNLFIAV